MLRARALTKEELRDQTRKVFEKKVKLMLRYFNRNQILTIADSVITTIEQ